MVKNLPINAGDSGSVPGLGRSPGEGNSNPLQCSGLENSMNYIVRGVANRKTLLSDFHFHFSSLVIYSIVESILIGSDSHN